MTSSSHLLRPGTSGRTRAGRGGRPRARRRRPASSARALVAGAVGLAVLALSPSSARARQVLESGDGSVIVEVGGFYKTFGAALLLPSGLVRGTEALAGAVEEARAAASPGDVPFLPVVSPLPREAGLSTQLGRIEGRLLWRERLDVDAAWQLGVAVASDPVLQHGVALGGTPVSSSGVAARRLWDFDPVLAESRGLRVQHDLDRLSVRLSLPGVDVVAGRQVLAWGTGKLWNPTDLLSPFAPTDIDKEVRRGVDALRVSVALGTTGLLDALWLPQEDAADQGGVLRGQLNVLGYDVSLSVAKYVSDVVLGADMAGDLGPLGVHAEAAYTLGMSGWGRGPLHADERFWRAVGGFEWKPADSWMLVAEYYFNGFGAGGAEGYLAKLASPRVARGEIFGAGRHYFGLASSWAATELLSVQTTVLVALQDPSAMLVPVLEYSAAQRVLVRAGGFVPLGAGPDARPLEALTAADVLDRTDDFRDATSGLGLRSEYGASAAGAFVQLGVYY